AKLDPQYLEDAAKVHFLADREQYYVLIQRKNPKNVPDAGPNFGLEAGGRPLNVNGQVYAFARDTGKLRWRFEAPQAVLVLDSVEELPFLLFSSRYQQPITNSLVTGMPQDLCQIRAIDKKSGKRLFDEKDTLRMPPFHTLRVDLEKHQLELTSDVRKI